MDHYHVFTKGTFKFSFRAFAKDTVNAQEQAQDFLSLLEQVCAAAGYSLQYESTEWEGFNMSLELEE